MMNKLKHALGWIWGLVVGLSIGQLVANPLIIDPGVQPNTLSVCALMLLAISTVVLLFTVVTFFSENWNKD